jgi:hypothetical protein
MTIARNITDIGALSRGAATMAARAWALPYGGRFGYSPMR